MELTKLLWILNQESYQLKQIYLNYLFDNNYLFLQLFYHCIYKYLPFGPNFYDEDTITDQPERQIVAEMIREKVLRSMGEEIPHGVAVAIDAMKFEGKMCNIDATIICERDNHKGMIIGKGGSKLKEIGSLARPDIEDMLQCKVFLKLWVKVKKDWSQLDKEIDENSNRIYYGLETNSIAITNSKNKTEYDYTDNELVKLVLYLFVGGTAALLEWSLFYGLINWVLPSTGLSVTSMSLLGTCIAYGLSTTYHYFLGNVLVFESGARFNKAAELTLVFIVSGMGLAFNLVLMYIFVGLLNWQPFLSKVVASFLCVAWNYLARKYFIFKK